MARTRTSMANIALSYVGDKSTLTNVDTDTTVAGTTCALHLSETIDQVLADPNTDFNCAKERAELSQDATAPDFGWLYRYALPDDYLRLRKHTDDEANIVNYLYLSPSDTASYPYTIEGDWLLTNKADCFILYIKTITDVAAFPPLLADAICVLLASKIATRLGAGKVMADNLLVAYVNEAMPKARAENQRTAYTENEEGVVAWGDAGRW